MVDICDIKIHPFIEVFKTCPTLKCKPEKENAKICTRPIIEALGAIHFGNYDTSQDS